ncbi:Glutathione hydrolase [Vigna angularis]|uniref:Glutathione hydrolase n=1 Tax=Phaseolus angularis TaxID=3914 RepID=A0A8T0KT06_PHAAN|nr:Glutathione hydrolase [Vigna angularis]
MSIQNGKLKAVVGASGGAYNICGTSEYLKLRYFSICQLIVLDDFVSSRKTKVNGNKRLVAASDPRKGLGGGAFMLLRQANGVSKAFDMRETAPSLASRYHLPTTIPDMYGGNTTLKAKGGLSVAVPRERAGLVMAWKQYGKLPWKRLVNPAEKLERGFKISAYLHMQIRQQIRYIARQWSS